MSEEQQRGTLDSPTMKQVPALLAAILLFLLLAVTAGVTDWWRADEGFTFWITGLPWDEMWRRIAADVHPPLFYLLVRGWRALFEPAWAVQGLTLLAGVGVVALGGWIGTRTSGARAGTMTALLLAVCSQLAHYSQDLRMYAWALFFEMIAVAGWVDAQRSPRRGWVLLVGGSLGALLSHNLCVIFVGFLFVWIFVHATLARCGQTRVPNGCGGGLRWCLTATTAVGILYAPWVPVLIRQRANPFLDWTYEPFHPLGLAAQQFQHAMWFNHPWANRGWNWIPGLIVWGLLPLAGCLWSRRRGGRDGAALFGYLWLAPVSFLLLYTWLGSPVFAFDRRALLFNPFLMFPAGALLARWGDECGWRGRGAALALVALLGGQTLMVMLQPRDFDFRPARDALIERAPVDRPIVGYPILLDTTRLVWQPMEAMFLPAYGDPPAQLPEHLPEATLVVVAGDGGMRREIVTRTRSMLSRVNSVQPVFESFPIQAYSLSGVPDGALRELTWPQEVTPDHEAADWLGGGERIRVYSPVELAEQLEPGGRLVARNRIQTDRHALRLEAVDSTLHLQWDADPTRGAMVVAVGGVIVTDQGPQAIRITPETGLPYEIVPGSGDFSFAVTAAPGSPGAKIGIQVAANLVADAAGTQVTNDAAGIYLTWAALVPFPETLVAKPGAPTVAAVGGVGDELFLRCEIHEREGAPPDTWRWSQGDFALDVVVGEGVAPDQVVLRGMLAQKVADRRVRVIVRGGGGAGRDLICERDVATGWSDHTFQLPEAIVSGNHRLEVEAASHVPAAEEPGGDPRRLGWMLAGVGLMESNRNLPALP